MFRRGRQYGPEAWTECIVSHPVSGGYISESFRYNPKQISDNAVKAVADRIWLRLRDDAADLERFERGYLSVCKTNRMITAKCK